MIRKRGAAWALVLATAFGTGPAVHASQREFTVADSIQMPRLVPPNLPGRSGGAAAIYSPGGSNALVTVTRGDLVRDTNVHELLLFRTADIRKFVDAARESPAPRPATLARIEDSSAAAELLANLKWINEEEVAFIAPDRAGVRQVFTVGLAYSEPRQITQSSTDVTSFDMAGGSVLYYSKSSARPPSSISVERQNMQQLLTPDSPYLVELWYRSALGVPARKIDLPVLFLLDYFQRAWLSPDGKRAIVLVPATRAPAHWARYQVPDYEAYGYTAERRRDEADSADLALRTRYALLDFGRNEVEPLLDAPSGHLSLNSSPVVVFWNTKAHSVIVSNTYLPFANTEASSAADDLRAMAPAIAEVSLESGLARAIAFEPYRMPSANRLSAPRIRSVEWSADDERLTITREGAENRAEVYRRKAGHWRKRVVRPSLESHRLFVRQSLNERPRLFVRARACSCERLLFDAAPGADAYSFGRAETFHWRDANGIEWRGGLIYPPDFSSGRSFPLVIQTHGFDESEFLIDGPEGITTAMAAQPLANAGMVVLQVEDNAQARVPDERAGAQYAEGYRAGIDALVSKGIVDPRKVGIIAFSSTGLPVIRLLADQPELLAAADISDASWWGYLQELMLTNFVPDLVVQYLRHTGSSLQRTPSELFGTDPLYRLPASRAAIRLEANGAHALVSTWEHYSVLRKAAHAVEFMYHPRGSHVLTRPSERLASQGGAVDWFRFWLEGAEDPDPAKAVQYERWRALRENARPRLEERPLQLSPAEFPPGDSRW